LTGIRPAGVDAQLRCQTHSTSHGGIFAWAIAVLINNASPNSIACAAHWASQPHPPPPGHQRFQDDLNIRSIFQPLPEPIGDAKASL